MDEKHFEIIVTSRQLALFAGGVVLLVAVGFGLGVLVGLAEPSRRATSAPEVPTTSAVAAEPTFVPSLPPSELPGEAASGRSPVLLEPAARPEPTAAAVALPTPTPAPAPGSRSMTPGSRPAVPTAYVVPTPVPSTPVPARQTATPVPVRTPGVATPPASSRPGSPTGVWVQVAALTHPDLAKGVRERIVALGFGPGQVTIVPADGKFRVRLGPFPDRESGERVLGRLREQGFPDAFLVVE